MRQPGSEDEGHSEHEDRLSSTTKGEAVQCREEHTGVMYFCDLCCYANQVLHCYHRKYNWLQTPTRGSLKDKQVSSGQVEMETGAFCHFQDLP